MVYLDFEKPIAELNEQLDKIKEVQNIGDVDVSNTIRDIEKQIAAKTKELYSNLTAWQQVQVSRHPQRPYTLSYIENIADKGSFVELKIIITKKGKAKDATIDANETYLKTNNIITKIINEKKAA